MGKPNNTVVHQQIKKLKRENKFLVIVSVAVFLIVLSLGLYFLLVDTERSDLGVGLLIALPFSMYFGGYCQIKSNLLKIQTLEMIDSCTSRKDN